MYFYFILKPKTILFFSETVVSLQMFRFGNFKDFKKFTGKYMYWSQILVKGGSITNVFLWISEISKNIFFTEKLWVTASGCYLHLFVVICFTTHFIRFHSLYFLLTLLVVIRCHLLSFVVPLVLVRRNSFYHSFVTRFHSMYCLFS